MTWRVFLVGLCAAAGLACSGKPQPAPDAEPKTQDPKTSTPTPIAGREGKIVSVEKVENGAFPYQLATLDNGLKILTLEDHSAPLAAVQLWYHVGSKNEAKQRHGFAHMFEHMMFRGTQKLGPKDHFEYIRKTGGDTNAYTAFDQTVYVQEVPANQVEMVLWLESERMAFLRIDEKGFDTERQVVSEEYRLRYEAPYGNVLDEVLLKLFPEHPYGWSPIGSLEDLRASTSSDLQKFWETYYIPNNATLVVVGDVNHAEVQEMARKYFGWIPSYPEPPTLAIPELPASLPALSVQAKNGPAPIVGIAFRGVPLGHEDELPLQILGSILGDGESSRLNRELVVNQKTAVFAGAGALNLESAGIFAAAAVLSPVGAKPDDARKALLAELEKIRTTGPTEAEFLKAKNNALRGTIEELRSAESKASRLGEALVIEKKLKEVNQRADQIRALTIDDLKKTAAKYLTPERAIPLTIEPSGLLGALLGGGKKPESQPASQPEEDNKPATGPTGKPGLQRPAWMADKPPVAAPLTKQAAPVVKENKLENGLAVVFVENHELPLVDVSLNLKAGAYTDPDNAPGTAAMTLQMLTRGTEAHDYLALAEELDTYAIQLSGSAGMDTARVGGSSIKDEAPRLFKLLAEVARRPTFPQDQLDLLRGQAKTGKAIEENEPGYLADRELRRRLFGAHPYSRTEDGESKDLDKLTVAGLKSWWQQAARPDGAVLYVSGDLSESEALAFAKEHFGDWKATGAALEPKLPEFPAPEATKIYLIDRPGDQAQIRVGYRALDYSDPRYFEGLVLGQVLGGGFTSRLNEAIRIKRGLTYGAGGGFSARRFAGTLRANTFSKNETVGEAVKVLLDEIAGLRSTPPSADETRAAQTYLTGSFVLQREAPIAYLNDHWLRTVVGLPADFFDQYLARISAATPELLKQAADALIQTDKVVIVVVGQADVLKPQLEKVAPVELVK